MVPRWVALLLVALLVSFLLGFRVSYVSGIQPGYYEKKEAPAYGVGGGEGLGVDLDKEVEDFYKNLYKDDEE